MAKPRSRTNDYLSYLVLRIAVCIVQALPYQLAAGLARGVAWLGYKFNRRHTEVALDNLRQAFPGQYDEKQLRRMVLDVYRHFLGLMVEILFLPRIFHTHNWKYHFRLVNPRETVGGLLSGKPLLVISGHYGNWELSSYAMGQLGFKSYGVARPLDNPYVDRFLRKFREKSGQKILAKKGELDRMEGILKDGGVVCMLADQDAGRKGMFVDFFGRPASTHKAIALLAVQHQAIILVTAAQKIGEPMRYISRVSDVIYPEEYMDRPDAVRYVTQRFTAGIERLVRYDPTQYFWLHRRWKHRPEDRKRKKKSNGGHRRPHAPREASSREA